MNFLELEKEFGEKLITSNEVVTEKSKAPYLVSPIISQLWKKAIGVIYVEDEDELSNVIQTCKKYSIPIVARGAGTSTIGQVLVITPSIVVDFSRYKKEMILGGDSVTMTPSVKVLDALNYLRKRGKELRVYPSSFYISTLGGYIAGGDVGIGSYQYGYHFDNGGVKRVKIVAPEGKTELSGVETLGVAQAAGTTGIITEVDFAIVDYEDWRDQIIRLNDLEEVVKKLKEFSQKRDKIRRVTIEDYEAFSLVSGGRIEGGKWNLLVASTLSLGEEVNLKFIDELAFAAIYVTMSRLAKFKNYFYEVRLLPLHSFSRIVKKVKEALGNKVLTHGDVMTLRDETIIYTVFMSERENFDLIDQIMSSEGIPFEIHSIYVNDRVDDPFRLELMKKYKRLLDPRDLLNPGKLRL